MTNKWVLLAAAPLVFIDGLRLNSHNVISTAGNATDTASSASTLGSLVVGFDQKTRTPVFETGAENYDNVYYTVDVDLGGQKIEVVPDTGSFSLLVTSKNCSECPHQGWNPAKSKTYKSLPRKSAQITFGSGRVWVVGARDTVHVGHSTVLNQRIWEIVDMGEGMRELLSSKC